MPSGHNAVHALDGLFVQFAGALPSIGPCDTELVQRFESVLLVNGA